jgi:predicted RND superfamily exporter protein
MLMRSLGRAVLKWRYLLLAVVALVSVLSLLSLANLEAREDETTWMDKDNPAREEYDRFKALFGSDRFILVAYETPDCFCRDELAYLDYLTNRLAGLPHISEATSLTTSEETVPTSKGTFSRDFLRISDAPCTEAERCALDARIADNSLVDGTLISGDREVLGIFLKVDSTLNGAIYGEVTKALETTLDHESSATGRQFYFAGGPISDAKVNAIMERDIALFTPLSLLISAVILFVLFRNWRAVLLPLLAVVLGLVWTFGLKASVGSPVTPVSATLVALIVIIGVANSVHFISHYRLELSRSSSPDEAMIDTFSRAGVPCFLTALTTAAGFASLLVSDIPLIRHLGVFAAFGIMSAFTLTTILLPVGLRGASLSQAVADRHSQVWNTLGSFVVSHSRLVIVLCILVSGLTALGAFKIQVEPSMVEYLKPDSEVRQAADFIDDHLSGSSNIELHIEGPPGSFEDVAVLQSIDHLQSSIENYAHVTTTVSPVEFVKAASGGSLPATDVAVARTFSFLQRAEDANIDEYYVSGATDSLRVSVRTKQMHLDERTKIITDIEDYSSRNLSQFTVSITGAEGLVNAITVDVVQTQVRSVIIAVVVILGLMLLFFGPRGALAAILPNIMPIAMVFGVMGLGGFELNIATITVAAICIGLVVDDTIHYFAHFRRLYLKSGDSRQAAVEALHEVGTALAFTTLTLTLGFAVFMLSESAFLVQFGFLALLALVVAFAADITVSPAILSRYRVFGNHNGLVSRQTD